MNHRLLCMLVLWLGSTFLGPAGWAQSLVRVSDTLYNADGTPASGRMVISWEPFTTADNTTLDGGTLSYTIPASGLNAGKVELSLASNAGATPAGTSYRVRYYLANGASYTETWVLPPNGPVAIRDIRVAVPPSPTLTINAATQLAGVVPLERGGTNQNAWTADRCVRVNSSGTALESAAADCGAGGGGGGGYAVIQDEGGALPARAAVNFIGGAVAASDDAANNRTNVTFSITDADLPASLTRDSEIHVQGTAAEIVSSGPGPNPTLGLASPLNLSGKNLAGGAPLVFDGATADANTTTVAVSDPTGSRTFTIPNADSVAVQPQSCGGTDKVSAISASGAVTCSPDQTGGGAAHNLLSATHTDTTTGTVVRGDLLAGQGTTPTWQRLALGANNTFLGSSGTDAVWMNPSGGGSVLGAGRTLTGGAGIAAIGDLSTDRTISTASQEAAFLADGGTTSLICGSSNQGKMQVMDNGALEYCDGAATAVLQRAALGDAGGSALSGDSATAFFSSGQLEPSRGGTGAANTPTAGRYLKGDGSAFLTSNGSASGTGSCAASNWVAALNSDAAPTCSRPAINDLSDASSVVTPSSTHTLTNKTVDVEGSGNTLTTVEKILLVAAGCNNATAAPGWDIPMSNGPVASCYGTSPQRFGGLDFADGASALTSTTHLRLPSDWTGSLDATFLWFSGSASTNSVVWTLATACIADGEGLLSPSFNAAQTLADANNSTANTRNTATISGITTTGCAAGETIFLRIGRDPTHASDTLAATATLLEFELTLRRAQ